VSATIVAVIAASAAAVVGVFCTAVSTWILKRVNQIHVLVNSRLDQALSEINDLKQQRDLSQHITTNLDKETS
jgi:hypothetical protein